MYLKRFFKKALVILLVFSMMLSLCACSTSDVLTSMATHFGISTTVQAGERLIDSPWINSDIIGSIDEATQLNLKDDFHTTVNREWLLAQNTEDGSSVNLATNVQKALDENILRLLSPDSTFDPDPNIMNPDALSHLQVLIWDMMELAGNQGMRNELGTAPLRPYLEAIEQIDSIPEMTAFLKNTDAMNFTGDSLINFDVDSPANQRDFYTVHIRIPTHSLLPTPAEYISIESDGHNTFLKEKEALHYVLGELGYSASQIDKYIMDCYIFEAGISVLIPNSNELNSASYNDRGDKAYSLEDIRKLQGNFPLTELLEAAGVAHSDSFRIYEPALLSYLGDYYTQKNLDKFKGYYLVHTVLDALPYLDDTCIALSQEIQLTAFGPQSSADTGSEENNADSTAANKKTMQLYNDYIVPLLYEPFQLAYIGCYGSSEAKQEILDTLDDIRTYYIELLNSTQWLSPETREKAVEKVMKMEFLVLYPDVLPDYSGLVYQGYDNGGNLLDAVAAIRKANGTPDVKNVNQPVRRSDWDLNSISTLEINAYNDFMQNRIIILSGIFADGFVYDEDAPIEQNYARIGVILGHEITHAFDTQGYHFDSEGLQFGWWTNDDEVAFRSRSDKLANHYTQLNVIPGQVGGYSGDNVQTEAIADMGGMKCMLALAKDIPDFNYDLFFRSFAQVWRCQNGYMAEIENASDVHPLGFLRTNVTVQQFEEFYETYDICPGDGMYLAPEDRISVW